MDVWWECCGLIKPKVTPPEGTPWHCHGGTMLRYFGGSVLMRPLRWLLAESQQAVATRTTVLAPGGSPSSQCSRLAAEGMHISEDFIAALCIFFPVVTCIELLIAFSRFGRALMVRLGPSAAIAWIKWRCASSKKYLRGFTLFSTTAEVSRQ